MSSRKPGDLAAWMFRVILIVMFADSILCPAIRADNCLHQLGNWGTGIFQDCAVQDGHVYCAASGAGLDIISLRDPRHPFRIGSCAFHGVANCIAVSGNTVVISDSLQTLHVIDASNVHSPVETGTCGKRTISTRIVARDTLVYSSNLYSGGIEIFDIADPAAPKSIGWLLLLGDTRWCALSDHYLLAGNSLKGLCIIDVIDPTAPILLSSWSTPMGKLSSDCVIVGNRAFIASGSLGLQVVDITDVTAPEIIGQLNVGTPINAVTDLGNDRLACSATDRLVIVDCSSPSDPTVLGESPTSVRIDHLSHENDLIGVTGDSGGLSLFRVSQTGTPSFLSSTTDFADFSDHLTVGSYAYAIDHLQGLRVFDLTEADRPRYLSTVPNLQWYNQVALLDQILVLGGNGILALIDISHPATPLFIEKLEIRVEDFAFDDGFAYCATGNAGLVIYDIANPFIWKDVGRFPVPADLVAADTGRVALAHGGTLTSVDCKNPYDPQELYSLPMNPVEIESLAFKEHFLLFGLTTYTLEDSSQTFFTLLIWDTDHAPFGPSIVGISMPAPPRELLIMGDRAIVVCDSTSKQFAICIDISEPLNPKVLGATPLLSGGGALSTNGQLITLTTTSGGQLQTFKAESLPGF